MAQSLAFIRAILRRFLAERLAVAAASLAFTSLLAVVPLATLVFGLAAQNSALRPFVLRLRDAIVTAFIPAYADDIRSQLDILVANAAALPLAGLVFLLGTAFLLLVEIETSFDQIWHHAPVKPRWWVRLLTLLSVLISMPVVALAAGWAVAVGISAADPLIADWLGHALTPIIAFITFLLLYLLFPVGIARLPAAMLGAALASLLLLGAKALFTLYAAVSPIQSAVYGALAALPLFQLWLFIFWCVALLGGLVAAEWQRSPLPGQQAQGRHRRQQHKP